MIELSTINATANFDCKGVPFTTIADIAMIKPAAIKKSLPRKTNAINITPVSTSFIILLILIFVYHRKIKVMALYNDV